MEPPPIPVLLESRLQAARARQKRTPMFARRKWESEPDAKPAPVLRNPWHVPVKTLPADAEKTKGTKPLRQVVPGFASPGRSRFRRGSIAFDETGFTLSGVGVTPLRWMAKIGNVGCLSTCAIIILFFWMVTQRYMGEAFSIVGWFLLVSVTVTVAGFALEIILTEHRRAAHTQTVPWGDLLEAQWERDLLHATLIFRTYEAATKPTDSPVIGQLTLNNLSPAHAAALWDALDFYTPDRNRPDVVIAADSNPLASPVLLSLFGIVLLFLTVIVVLSLRPMVLGLRP